MTCRSEKRDTYQARYNRRVYHAKRAAGICGWSGCREPATKTYCPQHMAETTTAITEMRDRRAADGCCVTCGCKKPEHSKFRSCFSCRKARNERRNRANAA